MPSLETLKSIYTSSKSLGDIRREQSNLIMESTWGRDPQNCVAFLYDFFHDSEPELKYNLSPETDPLKTPVPIKFIRHSENSDGKDQVSYHIQFPPSYSCTLDYYEEVFHKRYGADFPVGLYIDIPDGKGIYRRWLIVEDASRFDREFDKYSVYPVNYLLRWIETDGTSRIFRSMWGIERMRNSYNAGIYTDRIFTRVENQTVIWLPMNSITDKISYSDRFIVSASIECPLTWKVSKIENTIPLGINQLVLYQDKFNQNTDYVNLETGEMYADYYSSAREPESNKIPDSCYGEISVSTAEIKVGGGYKTLQVRWFDEFENDISDLSTEHPQWIFSIDGQDASKLISTKDIFSSNGLDIFNAIKIKFMGDHKYVSKVLEITAVHPIKKIRAVIELDIKAL